MSDESSLRKIPQSSTALPSTALSFAGKGGEKDVVFKIKQSSAPTPVINSAWSYGETEVFTNPTSEYQVKSSYIKNDDENSRHSRDVLIVELEETPNREQSG